MAQVILTNRSKRFELWTMLIASVLGVDWTVAWLIRAAASHSMLYTLCYLVGHVCFWLAAIDYARHLWPK